MRLFFAIIIALNSASVLTNGAEFSFKSTKHKFPDTKEGVVLEHDFDFTNTGDEPLVISRYEVTCNCTRVTFPQEPIPPGKSGKVHLIFETGGKYGFQSRKVQLYSNSRKGPVTLLFKVWVLNEEKEH